MQCVSKNKYSVHGVVILLTPPPLSHTHTCKIQCSHFKILFELHQMNVLKIQYVACSNRLNINFFSISYLKQLCKAGSGWVWVMCTCVSSAFTVTIHWAETHKFVGPVPVSNVGVLTLIMSVKFYFSLLALTLTLTTHRLTSPNINSNVRISITNTTRHETRLLNEWFLMLLVTCEKQLPFLTSR